MIGEVELEFQQRGEFQQLFAQTGELCRYAASELAHGHLVGSFVGRGYQVGNGFSLREVHLAVQVSAHGVFARLGHAATVLYQQLQDLIQYIA